MPTSLNIFFVKSPCFEMYLIRATEWNLFEGHGLCMQLKSVLLRIMQYALLSILLSYFTSDFGDREAD